MAILGALGALYMSNPVTALTTFSTVNLLPNSTHKVWTAPYGSRFWSRYELNKTLVTFLIEKEVHGTGGSWVDITSLCTFDYLNGRITLAASLNSDDLVRASGKRIPVVKLAELLSVSLTPQKDKAEVTNFDSLDMWAEFLPSTRSWVAKAKRWYDINRVAWKLYKDLTETPLMFVMFTTEGTGKENIAGSCFIDGYDPNFDVKAAADEDLSMVGTGGLIYQTNAETTLRTQLAGAGSETTVDCVDNALFASVGIITVEAEQIAYTGKTGTSPTCSFTGCTRGFHSTTKAAHTVGERIAGIPV